MALGILYAGTIPINGYLRDHYATTTTSTDIIQNVFGGMREMVADWAGMRAEEYFHRGMPYLTAMSFHEGQSALAEASRGYREGEEDHHEHEAVSQDFFSRIQRAVKVTVHSHLLPSEEKEVLPWFYIEVKFNPHDINGYTLGGYYLERLERTDEALSFLKQGTAYNPRSASILAALAWAYLKKQDLSNAVNCLEKARALWLERSWPNDAHDSYSQDDRFFTFDLLGNIYAKNGKREQALAVYREIYRIDPRPQTATTIEELTALR